MADMNNDRIDDIIHRLKFAREELEEIKNEFGLEQYRDIRKSLNVAISSLNKADRDITNLKGIEGQISIEDYLKDM